MNITSEYIETKVFELSKIGNEMCYKTSALFIDFFPGEIEEKSINTVENLIKYISNREFEVYNIELHLEINIPEYIKSKLIKNLPIYGLIKHMVNKPGKIRLFTHAFNIVLDDKNFSIYQSWFQAHKYRRVVRNERQYLEKYLNDISIALKNILVNPVKLFSLFNLTFNEFSKMCDYPTFYKLLERIRKSENDVASEMKLQILVERKNI